MWKKAIYSLQGLGLICFGKGEEIHLINTKEVGPRSGKKLQHLSLLWATSCNLKHLAAILSKLCHDKLAALRCLNTCGNRKEENK